MDHDLSFGWFELKVHAKKLLFKGQPVALGGRAFEVLLVLVQNRERILLKSELLKAVWGGMRVDESNLHMQISSLRRALGHGLILTVSGRG